uniref:Uncharacterized protein n=1 Tax=Kryptolebias marmoratus TaxID=37003 RepID=A0A3Q3AZ11_KRYMA
VPAAQNKPEDAAGLDPRAADGLWCLKLPFRIKEQKIVLDELSNLKKNRRVFIQQRNSNIFFLADRSQTLSSCKNDLDVLKKELQDV